MDIGRRMQGGLRHRPRRRRTARAGHIGKYLNLAREGSGRARCGTRCHVSADPRSFPQNLFATKSRRMRRLCHQIGINGRHARYAGIRGQFRQLRRVRRIGCATGFVARIRSYRIGQHGCREVSIIARKRIRKSARYIHQKRLCRRR